MLDGARPQPPGSYFLGQKATGELCGSSFWIRFNQRYHRLRPEREVYTAEIERSLINVILANQAAPDVDPPGIRYFAQLVGKKANPTNIASCCESQATRTYGALPEFIYSTGQQQPEGSFAPIYVNLFVPSTFERGDVRLSIITDFPSGGKVQLQMAAVSPSSSSMDGIVMVRIPAWVSEVAQTVPVTVQDSGGTKNLTGTAGSYLKVVVRKCAGIVSFNLPIGLRLSIYNGTTVSPPEPGAGCAEQPPGGENNRTRAAIEYGPVLLAAVASSYAANHTANCSVVSSVIIFAHL